MKKTEVEQAIIELNSKNIALKSNQIMNAESYLKDFSIYIEEIIQYREFDVVVKAYDKYYQRNVFVNIIFNQDIQMKQEIDNEILFLKQIRSEYLMNIFECYFYKDISCLIIVMEYCSNGCFLSYYNSHKDVLTNEQIINLIKELSIGLKEIFNKSVINFKLNPQNLFLQESLQLKVYHLDQSRFQFNKLNDVVKARTSICKPNQLLDEQIIFKSNIYCALSIIDLLSQLEIKESLTLKLFNEIFFQSNQEFEEEMRVIFQRMKFSIQTNKEYEIIYNELIQNQKYPTSIRSQKQSDKYKDIKNGFWIYYYENGDIYEGDWLNDKKSGKGIQQILGGVDAGTYDGEFLDDKYHGSGTYYANAQRRYKGEFKNGLQHGKGTFFYKNGNRYEGEFENGFRSGKGIIFFKNGNRYEGEFQNDKYNGKGIILCQNGSRYEGEFKNHAFNGQGNLFYNNGDRYEGEFKNNTLNGQGAYIYKNGDRLEGEFQNGFSNGKGFYFYQSGDRYEGEFKNSIFSGQGTIIYKNGNRYEGEFENGSLNGKGFYSYSSGDRYEGEFKNSFFSGQGTIIYKNGNRYDGEFENGFLSGKGFYFYQNGDRYEGEFQNNFFNGKGTYFYKNGDRYQGMFDNGFFNGQGTFIYKNGDQQSGQWKNGKYNERCNIF